MQSTRLALPLILLTALTLTSCSTPPPTSTRSGKLLTMAAEEAGFITSLPERLTRQLNIADLQIQTNQKPEALKTLALAADTLRVEEADKKADKKTLDEFGRIAGWTSVAQLYHTAGNDKIAVEAYINAVEALHSVNPEVKRAQYVLSLSEIAFQLKGKEEAGRLLVSGGEWATKIDDASTRRYALTTFASALVSYDNLDAARTVMRNEPDAAWRAETFAALARSNVAAEPQIAEAAVKSSAALAERTMQYRAVSKEGKTFNIDVQYQSNYRQQQLQQGLLPNATDPTH